MYYVKIINSQQCVLESRTVKDYDNDSITAIFKEYAKPANIHIDIEDYDTGAPVACYKWSDLTGRTIAAE